MAIDEISTVKYRIYLLAIKYQIDLFCAIPELSYLTVPDVPGSDKCRRYHLFYTFVSIESVTNGCLAFFHIFVSLVYTTQR